MTINMYSVIKAEGFSKVIVSFTDKDEAERHAEALNLMNQNAYTVLLSELNIFEKVSTKDFINEKHD